MYADKDYNVFKSAIADKECPTCEGVAKSEALSVSTRVNPCPNCFYSRSEP